jgi:hypothetical protein
MTQKEFTEAKAKGLKEREIYYKKEILKDFESALNQYFNTNRESITISNRKPFTPKQVVAIINETYPDLKLKATDVPCKHEGLMEYEGLIEWKIKIIPKKKHKILFWEVWI